MRIFLLTFLSILVIIYCRDTSNSDNLQKYFPYLKLVMLQEKKQEDGDKINKLLDSIFSVDREKRKNDTTILSGGEDKNQTFNVQIKDFLAGPERREANNTTTSEKVKKDQDEIIIKLLNSIFSVDRENGKNDTTITSMDEDKNQTFNVQINGSFPGPEGRENNNTTTSKKEKEDQDEIFKFLDSIFSVDRKNGTNDTTITSRDEDKNQTFNVQINGSFSGPEGREDNNTITFKNNENKEQRLETIIKSIFTVGEKQKNAIDINPNYQVKLDEDQKRKVLSNTDSGIIVFPGEEHLYYKKIKSRVNKIISSVSSEKFHSDIIFPEN